jgi:hypothetical protein
MARGIGIVSLALAVSVLGVGNAKAAGIDGTGAVGTCPDTGKIAIEPALTDMDHGPGNLKVTTQTPRDTWGPGLGATGDGLNVLGSTSKGVWNITKTVCARLLGTSRDEFIVVGKWQTAKGTPKLNPSAIMITRETGGVTGDGHFSLDLSGTVVVGSFFGDAVSGHIETDQSVADILTACGGKGVKKLSFGGNRMSTFTIE